jgi:predicted dehydrogenase
VHRAQAIAALDRGLTVFCEKPPALSLADLDEIIAAEQRSAGAFATVFQQRYGGGAEQLRALVADGTLGRPATAVCHTLWFRSPAYFAVDWRGRWETEGGGPTMGHGIHQMDLMLSVLGPWREVTAVATRIAQPTNTEDVSAALVTFECGAIGSVLNTLLAPRQTSYLRFDFERATAELEHYDRYGDDNWTLTAGDEITARWAAARTGVISTHAAQLEHVLDALDRGDKPPVTSADARATLELSAAIYASAFTGRPVRRGEIDASSPFYASMPGKGAPWPPVK